MTTVFVVSVVRAHPDAPFMVLGAFTTRRKAQNFIKRLNAQGSSSSLLKGVQLDDTDIDEVEFEVAWNKSQWR